MRFRLSRQKRKKTIALRVVTQVELSAHATDTRACDIFGNRFHFDAFSTAYTNPTCINFVLILCQVCFQIDRLSM